MGSGARGCACARAWVSVGGDRAKGHFCFARNFGPGHSFVKISEGTKLPKKELNYLKRTLIHTQPSIAVDNWADNTVFTKIVSAFWGQDALAREKKQLAAIFFCGCFLFCFLSFFCVLTPPCTKPYHTISINTHQPSTPQK